VLPQPFSIGSGLAGVVRGHKSSLGTLSSGPGCTRGVGRHHVSHHRLTDRYTGVGRPCDPLPPSAPRAPA
jgi:hypothetical protein